MFRKISAFSKISILANRHPFEKVLLSIIPIIILGYSKGYIPLFINIIVFALLHYACKNPRDIVLKFTLGTALFALISSITFILDYGVYSTGIIVLKAINGGACVSYLALTTPLDNLLLITSKFKFLREVCDIAKNMERFIFIIEDEYNMLVNAVKSRGGFDGFKGKIKDAGKVAGLLLVNTLNRWKDIHSAINARCYRGYMSYIEVDFSLSAARIALIIIYNILLILMIKYL